MVHGINPEVCHRCSSEDLDEKGYNRCVWDKPNKWGGCDYYMNREIVEATWKEGEQNNEGTEV